MSGAELTPIAVPLCCKIPHRGTQLSNGVKVIVIQDTKCTRSSAAMNVRVGSNADPVALPGLAHYCEHMLFMGTTKYPKENEYDNFISSNGGHNNAWTKNDSTQYYFDVSTEAFEGALDRFLNFFVAPLFSEGSLEREVRAVHSEDEKNHNSEYWRLSEVIRELANPEHPLHRYQNGNEKTLSIDPKAAGINVRDELVAFYNKYYVAEAFSLAIYSPHPPEHVMPLVEQVLQNARASPRAKDVYPAPPFIKSELGRWQNVATVTQLQKLRMIFPIPFSWTLWRTKPVKYISHIIGHECKGSLLDVLKQRMLVEELMAGASTTFDEEWSTFLIEVGLTDKGKANIDEIVRTTFEYIHYIRSQGVTKEMLQDTVNTETAQFTFSDIEEPYQHISMLSEQANKYGVEDAWRGNILISEPDAVGSQAVMDALVPENCLFFLRAREMPEGLPPYAADIRMDRVTTHHKVTYGSRKLPDALLAEWRTAGSATAAPTGGAMPKANPFLTNEFQVLPPGPGGAPVVHNHAHGTLYHRQDTVFQVPKSYAKMEVMFPEAYTSPTHRFYTRVFVHLIKDAVMEDLYFAELAALVPHIRAATAGIDVSVDGASPKLRALVEIVVKTLLQLQPTEERVALYCDKVRRELHSAKCHQPYSLCSEILTAAVHTTRWTLRNLLEVCDGCNAAGFAAFLPTLRSSVRFKTVYTGNCSADDATAFVAMLEGLAKEVPAAPEDAVKYTKTVNILPEGKTMLQVETAMNPNDENSCVEIACQTASTSDVSVIAANDVFSAAIHSGFFNVLRTSETMGYIVFSGVKDVNHIDHFRFLVQSAEFSPDYIHSRIYAFVEAIDKHLTDMTDETFRGLVSAQIARREDYPKNTKDEGDMFWRQSDHPLGFDHQKQEIVALKALTLADVVAQHRRYFANESASRRRLVVLYYGSKCVDDAAKVTVVGDNAVALPLPPKTAPTTGDEEIVTPDYKEGAHGPVSATYVPDLTEFRKGLSTFI